MLTIRRCLWMLIAVSCQACSSGQEPRREPVRANVVLIVSDALRHDVLSCYGGEARTPTIDALARRGVVFENAYCNSPWTTPSSVSIFTGNYATAYPDTFSSDFTRVHVPDDERLLAEALRDVGYMTLARIDNLQARLHNNLQGFDLLHGAASLERATTAAERQVLENLIGRRLDAAEPYGDLYPALVQLLRIPPHQRFFWAYWMLDPHAPYNPMARFRERIDVDPSRLPQPVEFYTKAVRGKRQLSPIEQTYLWKLYVAEVESVDERVGYIIETLRHVGALDSTYIIFTTDHGEQFGERGEWGHGAFGRNCNYYETLMRIPLIVAGPGLPEGKRVQSRVSLVDLMPTLKELLGIEYPDDMQGHSFASLLRGSDGENRSVYFTDVRGHDHVAGLLEGDFKLIASSGGEFELYNLREDSREENNLAAARPDRVRVMSDKIRAQMQENQRRMAAAAAPDSTHDLDEEELRKTVKELKALGYIR